MSDNSRDQNEEFKRIQPEDFLKLDYSAVTLVDLREPDERIIDSIPGAVNLPFSRFPKGLDQLPKDKPVYVYCSHGDFSEQVAEILQDRGYDVTNVDGGFRALQAARNDHKGSPSSSADTSSAAPSVETPSAAPTGNTPSAAPSVDTPSAAPTGDTSSAPQAAEAHSSSPSSNAASAPQPKIVEIDAKGLKCPGPIVRVGDALRAEEDGTRFHVQTTEDAFCSDIRIWCERTGNRLDSLQTENGVIDAWLTRTQDAVKKGTEGKAAAVTDTPHGKNFVVFDDDLDKVIAAFIMANGAAAMGRPVTMFFTFWGLNVLRKPEKVKVPKTFIEKMFGAMMPRGTGKLPLSHMNMGGAGPKMIRSIMKQHNITSVEDLIQSALDHGVRIIVCQMSMEIMGIRKEELIDGLEYGGVSTFLGNAELSDMSLFI